jgi:hypothetical protein
LKRLTHFAQFSAHSHAAACRLCCSGSSCFPIIQICREFERFGKPLNVKVGNFFGGMDIKAQKDMLKDEDKCPDIVVGTPGRIKQVRTAGCGSHTLYAAAGVAGC